MQKYWQKVRYKRHKKTKMCIVFEIKFVTGAVYIGSVVHAILHQNSTFLQKY